MNANWGGGDYKARYIAICKYKRLLQRGWRLNPSQSANKFRHKFIILVRHFVFPCRWFRNRSTWIQNYSAALSTFICPTIVAFNFRVCWIIETRRRSSAPCKSSLRSYIKLFMEKGKSQGRTLSFSLNFCLSFCRVIIAARCQTRFTSHPGGFRQQLCKFN